LLKQATNFVLSSNKSSTYPEGTPAVFSSPAALRAARLSNRWIYRMSTLIHWRWRECRWTCDAIRFNADVFLW